MTMSLAGPGLTTTNTKKRKAKGFTKHACVDTTGKVVRPPKFLKEIIANAESE